tara:strand:- start:13072 stop:14541 length:1470 start_codon:yes stop_codon:yes gene_type:complete
MRIKFDQVKVQVATFTLCIEQWDIKKNQSWGVFSTQGDVGSLLGNLLCDEPLSYTGNIEKEGVIAQVSLSEQQRLLDVELANDDSEFMDRIDTGSSVYSLIFEQCKDKNLTAELIKNLDLQNLQESGFRILSTGETRRVMLARALAKQPEFLVLDEPFVGLDVAHRKSLADYLATISNRVRMLVIVSREEELPKWVDKVALFSEGKLDSVMDKKDWDDHPVITQIKAQSAQQSEDMIALIQRHRHSSKFENPIFELKNGRVAYSDKTIFSDVNWRINKGEHWQISGPNGCGKSTLLGLIFGDHPQCYSNDIQIFGRKRGTGETIWEIKKHIGMVSSALHLQYRVNCSALDVILSGFYDSIGLYQKPSIEEQDIAREWLEILHMGQFSKTTFKQLEYCQQRLLLIARAIVKQPTLLILDEPYQGLDYLGRRLIKSALELIAKENLSQLLYVSHYQADKLESIQNYLNFIPDKNNSGYQIELMDINNPSTD